MRYALLLANDAADVARWRAMSPEEAAAAREASLPHWLALFERMDARQQRVSGLELEDPSEARTVRVLDGETVVTDGPYAETKELVGGLLVVDCADLDEAIELAASVPLVSRGSVEIRPVVE
ncbi:MAG: YciI family protein [Pseudomonadota bacterium]